MQKLISLFIEWCKAREDRQRTQAFREGFFWAIDEYCFYLQSTQSIYLECEIATIRNTSPKHWRDDFQDEVIKGAQAAVAFITHGVRPD